MPVYPQKQTGPKTPVLQYLLVIIGVATLIYLMKPKSETSHGSGASINMNPDMHQHVQRLQLRTENSGPVAVPVHATAAVTSTALNPASAVERGDLPTWSEEFWTPIDVGGGADPKISLCKLDFKQYWEAPHLNSMFKDFTQHSGCRSSRSEKLSKLLREIKDQEGTPGGRIVPPTFFVFHESRVGSTLVANSFASDPWAMTFSESSPMASALMHCNGCSHEEHVQFFRDMTTLMGRSPFHRHLFFKFQSATTTFMEIALEAFPDTPWAFIYRNPVQTMMSHLDPRKGGGQSGAVCLRSQSQRPKKITEHLKELKLDASAENWCAAHLNYLCTSAMEAYEKYATFASDPSRQRGMLVNYESLPGAVPNVLLPMAGVQVTGVWLETIARESQMYSKSRGPKIKPFSGDSQDKEAHATDEINVAAEKLMDPLFEKMNAAAVESMKKFRPDVYALVMPPGSSSTEPNWKAIKAIPSADAAPLTKVLAGSARVVGVQMQSPGEVTSGGVVRRQMNADAAAEGQAARPAAVAGEFVWDSARYNISHSYASTKLPYEPWAAFSNTHTSQPMERVKCPATPPDDYPKHYLMTDIVENWNPDNTEIPTHHYDSLCHFDYTKKEELSAAYAYRDADKPFVLYNHPELDETVKRWSDLNYLKKILGKGMQRTEASKDNHFMYWKRASKSFRNSELGKLWQEPTQVIQTTFEDWLNVAVAGQNKSLENREHQYFRVSSGGKNDFVFEELPFFKPKKNVFMIEPTKQRGIHCRFGMRSVTAEAHFDGSLNAVVMLGGLRRWIMSHPKECSNMHMLKGDHPSARHTSVDWSKPDLDKYPDFKKLKGHEVIIQPGDFLFVPTYWLHSIVSLNVNYQCNTRSGGTSYYDKDIHDCGFGH